MFLQVKVPIDDRNLLRYLWWPEGDTSRQIEEYRMTSRVFRARSSPSVVNFCLRKTAEDYGHLYDDETTTILLRNFYVDNLLKSFYDEARCVILINDLINVCRDGGFRLNQWTANNKRVLATVPEGERDDSVAVLDLSKDELPTERDLGIHWDMNDDNFTF
ncbi:uncharacterized protein [Macrobrachium rosenbergii]|uniref:uncharacterized protein n=1 Tax=Macrobrachium rosenbergii TaxID=79674 RepID=UPI0034D7838D